MKAWPLLSLDGDRPTALLADIHANIDALQAVCAYLDRQGVDQALVLGDIVGYGASPVRVIDEIDNRGWAMIRGNHEDMLGSFDTVDARGRLKSCARRSIEWTRRQLDDTARHRLARLPTAGRCPPHLWAVHGSLVDPTFCYAYIYELSLDLNVAALERAELPAGSLVAHGHTHHAGIFRVVGGTWSRLEAGADGSPTHLDPESRWLINPGSVGYPRDGDPRASFMIWEPATRRLGRIRLPYDVEAAARRIDQEAYAPGLAERLRAAR